MLIGGVPYFMPNGIADSAPGLSTATAGSNYSLDYDTTPTNPPVNPLVRLTAPVPGRWGEAQSVPGYPIPTAGGPVNLVGPNYNNHVRAGYSWDVGDLINGQPRDAADDNFNSFDPYPAGHTGEVGDYDLFDLAGALLFPVERMRRYVAPADINGTGLRAPME